MHGLVVFLVLVPASLVFYAIWGHLPGEAETEKKNEPHGQLWRAEGLERNLTHPTRTLPHQLGRRGHQKPSESQQEWPPEQAAGRGGPGQAHGALFGSADQTGWRPRRKVGSPDVLSSSWPRLPKPGRLGRRAPGGRERPGLASRAPAPGSGSGSGASRPGAGAGSSGSRGRPVAIATGEEEQAWPPRRRAGGGGREST